MLVRLVISVGVLWIFSSLSPAWGKDRQYVVEGYGTDNPIGVEYVGGSNVPVWMTVSTDNSRRFSVNVSSTDFGAYFEYSSIIAHWQNERQEINIRLPKSYSNYQIYIPIYQTPETLNIMQVRELETLGYEGRSAFRVYFEARAIYRYMYSINAKSEVAHRSACLWFEAAYSLASREQSFVPMDQQARNAVMEILRLADRNRDFGRVIDRHRCDRAYLKGMLSQSQFVRWKFYGQLPSLIKIGKIKEASLLHSAFRADFILLDDMARAAVIQLHGVDIDRLTEDGEYLRTLRREKQ